MRSRAATERERRGRGRGRRGRLQPSEPARLVGDSPISWIFFEPRRACSPRLNEGAPAVLPGLGALIGTSDCAGGNNARHTAHTAQTMHASLPARALRSKRALSCSSLRRRGARALPCSSLSCIAGTRPTQVVISELLVLYAPPWAAWQGGRRSPIAARWMCRAGLWDRHAG